LHPTAVNENRRHARRYGHRRDHDILRRPLRDAGGLAQLGIGHHRDHAKNCVGDQVYFALPRNESAAGRLVSPRIPEDMALLGLAASALPALRARDFISL
jgi:hypothetical protein